MAATKTRPRTASRNNGAVAMAKHAGDTSDRAPRSRAGTHRWRGRHGGPRRRAADRVASRTAAVGRRAGPRGRKRFAAAAGKASNTADDIRAIREQLDNANRRSPIEVVLDGLTHRPGTEKRKRQFNIGS